MSTKSDLTSSPSVSTSEQDQKPQIPKLSTKSASRPTLKTAPAVPRSAKPPRSPRSAKPPRSPRSAKPPRSPRSAKPKPKPTSKSKATQQSPSTLNPTLSSDSMDPTSNTKTSSPTSTSAKTSRSKILRLKPFKKQGGFRINFSRGANDDTEDTEDTDEIISLPIDSRTNLDTVNDVVSFSGLKYNFSFKETPVDHWVSSISTMSHITYLEITKLDLSKPHSKSIFDAINSTNLPNLQWLVFSSCRRPSPTSFDSIAASNPTVSKLEFNATNISDTVLEQFANHLSQSLTHLRLDFIDKITDSGFITIASFVNLTHLALNHLSETITGSGLPHIFRSCSHLSYISFENAPNIVPKSLSLKSSPTLRYIKIANCPLIDSSIFTGISPFNTATQILTLHCQNLEKFTDSETAAVVKLSPNLTFLNLSGCKKVSQATITAIASLKRLKTLKLNSLPKINGSSTKALSQHPSITSISLSGCNIKGQYLIELVAGVGHHTRAGVLRRFSNISSLEIVGNKHVTDSEMAQVLEHTPKLTSLSISNCKKLGDATLTSLGKFCPRLTHIHAASMTPNALSAVGLRDLEAGCPRLVEINIAKNNSITLATPIIQKFRDRNISILLSTGTSGASSKSINPKDLEFDPVWDTEPEPEPEENLSNATVSATTNPNTAPNDTDTDTGRRESLSSFILPHQRAKTQTQPTNTNTTTKDRSDSLLSATIGGLFTGQQMFSFSPVPLSGKSPGSEGSGDAELAVKLNPHSDTNAIPIEHQTDHYPTSTLASAHKPKIMRNLISLESESSPSTPSAEKVIPIWKTEGGYEQFFWQDEEISTTPTIVASLDRNWTSSESKYSDPLQYSGIKIEGIKKTIPASTWTDIIATFSHITHISLTRVDFSENPAENIDAQDYFAILKNFPSLDWISISSCKISHSNVESLVNHVSLSKFEISSSNISSESIALICAKWDTVLTHLRFDFIDTLNDSSILSMSNLKNISHFVLDNCYGIQGKSGIHQLFRNVPIAHLSLLNMADAINDTNLAALGHDGKGNNTLIHLNLSGCTGVSNTGLKSLICPNLRGIDLNGASSINDQGIISLSQNCHKLTFLSISKSKKLGSNAWEALVQNCPNLETVIVSNSLKFNGSHLEILSKAKNLKTIKLAYVPNIKGKHLLSLVDLPGKPDLKYLDISGISTITNKDMTVLLQHLPNLETFKMSQCKKLGDDTFVALHRNCPKLKRLHAIGMTPGNLSVVGLRAIEYGCPNLIELNISRNFFAPDPILDKLRDKGIELTTATSSRRPTISMS